MTTLRQIIANTLATAAMGTALVWVVYSHNGLLAIAGVLIAGAYLVAPEDTQ